MFRADLPVVEQEAEVGQSDRDLQPPPVRKCVRHPSQHQEPHREGDLVEDPHCPPVGQPHELCDCRENPGGQRSPYSSGLAVQLGGARVPTSKIVAQVLEFPMQLSETFKNVLWGLLRQHSGCWVNSVKSPKPMVRGGQRPADPSKPSDLQDDFKDRRSCISETQILA